jgi:hypothetical protein
MDTYSIYRVIFLNKLNFYYSWFSTTKNIYLVTLDTIFKMS